MTIEGEVAMLADQDDPLETITEMTPTEPRVIVVYRSRGVPWLLIPPLLLIAVVASIIVYRKTETPAPPRPSPLVLSEEALALSEQNAANLLLAQPEQAKPVVPQPILAPEPPQRAPDPLPVTVSVPQPAVSTPSPFETDPSNTAPAPSPALPAVQTPEVIKPDPEEIAIPPVEEPARREPVGFDPEAAKVAAAALAAPKPEEPKVAIAERFAVPERGDTTPPGLGITVRPKSDEALDEEQRESEERLAARARLDPAAKPDLLNPNSRDTKAARNQLIAESRKFAHQDRAPFHAELRQLLVDQGNKAGPYVQQLCNRYRRDTVPEIHSPLNRDLLGPSARLSTTGRIKRMRAWGIPETIILDDLVASEIDAFRRVSGTPNDSAAWVRASKILLSNPPVANSVIKRAPGSDASSARSAIASPGGL